MTDAEFELARLFRDDVTPERDEAFTDHVMADVARRRRAEMAGRLALSVAGIICVLGLAVAAPAVIEAFGSVLAPIAGSGVFTGLLVFSVVGLVFGRQVLASRS